MSLLLICWILYGIVFFVQAKRVTGLRKEDPLGENQRRTDPNANRGMWLEAMGIGLAFVRVGNRPENTVAAGIGIALAFASVALGAMAIRELGMQWRIQAVVTAQHRLVTTGPYALVRNPIYTSLLGMLVASGLVMSTWYFTAAGVVVYLIGTEIRVRAEERLLSEKFGAEFEEYRRRVPAYIPYVR